MTNTERLLKEFDSCYAFLMSQMRDIAEEEGDKMLAAGWAWLIDNHRWPKSALVRAGKEGSYVRFTFLALGRSFDTRRESSMHRLPAWVHRNMKVKQNKSLGLLMYEAASSSGRWIANGEPE